MDPTAINTTSNGQYLFSHGIYNLCSISGYGHFTPDENDGHLYPSNYSDPHAGCFTCLILFKLYNNPTSYILLLLFFKRKDWGLVRRISLPEISEPISHRMGLKSTSLGSSPSADGLLITWMAWHHIMSFCVARTEKMGRSVAAVKCKGLR